MSDVCLSSAVPAARLDHDHQLRKQAVFVARTCRHVTLHSNCDPAVEAEIRVPPTENPELSKILSVCLSVSDIIILYF